MVREVRWLTTQCHIAFRIEILKLQYRIEIRVQVYHIP